MSVFSFSIPNAHQALQQVFNQIAAALTNSFQKGQDVELARDERLLLRSPSGTSWPISVDDAGNIGTEPGSFSGAVTTTDATTTTVATAAIAAGSAAFLEVTVVGRRTGGAAGTAGDSAGYRINAVVKNIAGTLTIVAQSIVFSGEDQAGWNASLAISSANILIQVTGAISNTADWRAAGRLYSAT